MEEKKNVQRLLREALDTFLRDPDPAKLKQLLSDGLGEFNALDFKEEYPDNAKLAKHILGFANSGGGCLLVGVRDGKGGTPEPIGMDAGTDAAELANQVREVLPETLTRDISLFTFAGDEVGGPTCAGRVFQLLVVHPDERHLPFLPRRATTGLVADTVYVRRNTQTVVAKKDDLIAIFNRLSAATKKDSSLPLEEHLKQLRHLYGALPPEVVPRNAAREWLREMWGSKSVLLTENRVPNPHYPTESCDEYLARLLADKKRRIEGLLDL